MNRRKFLSGIGLLTIPSVTGCLSAAEPQTIENLNIHETDRKTIRVTGNGVVNTAPDAAELTVSVERSDPDSASTVVEELATASQELLDALLEFGIPDENITTARYSLRENSRSRRIEGEHRYLIELNDPDSTGEVIDVAVEAGADSIGRINFTLSEDRKAELYDEAVNRAVSDASREATLYTEATGQSLQEPVSIDTTQTGFSPFSIRYSLSSLDASDDVGTTIESGDVAVTAQVEIEYEFK